LLGLANGLIITKLKIPDFIATLATMLAYRGFAQVWMGARILSRFPAAITYLGNARWGIVPVCVIVAVLVVVAGYFLYTRTKFGRYTIAIGGNRRAAIHAGIPVDRYKIYTYAFAGFMAALAAVIRLGNLDTYTAYLGEGYLLPTIAGVVIGGTALYGGIGRVWGSLGGALFITMLINGLVVLGLSYYWQQFTVGVLIVLAVAVYTVTGLRQSRGVGGGG
jgi:ribose transport system permease protein